MSKSGDNENEELITHSLEAAAHEAAMADGLIPTDGTDSKLKKAGLRRGKWTAEEESYANRLIYEFKLGLLPLTDGTTLRTFLSKLLNCDPMRISKKFVGQNCIGKQVFRRRQQDLEKLTPEQIETSRKELAELERKFLERVAQTNRTKTSGVKVVKDGRADDENGNQAIAPWMVPPDEVQSTGNDSSQRSTAPTPNANSSSSYVVKDPPFTAPPAFPNNPPTNNRMMGYGVGPDMLTVDYQHVISANNALMNQLYQGAQFPYMPNYPLPPPGFLRPDYHMNNPMNPGNIKPEQMGMHYPPFDPYYGMHLQNNLIDANGQFRNDAFPWSQHGALNGHDLHSSTSNAGNNNGSSSSNAGNGHEVPTNSLTHYPNNGNSTSEWNLQNLLGAGESMENIVQFLSQYQGNSQSFENVQAALHNSNNPSHSGSNSSNNNMKKEDGEKESHLKDSEKDNHSKKNSMDDVGYPLDDGAVTTISTSTPAPVNSSSSVRKTSPQNDRSKSDVNNSVNKSGETKAGKELSEMNGYIIPSDTMASMAPLYQRNGLSDQARMGPPFMSNLPMPGMDPAQTSFGAAAAAVANGGNLPRNSSIENFWMLVRMGDLPRPDQDVLSETIWEAHQQGGPKNGNPLKPEGPSKSSDSNSVSSNSKNVPSIPSSSLGLGRVKEETGKNLYPQGHPARIVPPIIVPPPNTNWLPAESRKRNEEAMSDRSSASYSNPPKPSSESTHYAKKVKIEKDQRILNLHPLFRVCQQ